MDSAKLSASEQLRSKAKKLEMLATLLDDGEIAGELAGLFSSAPAKAAPIEPTKPIVKTQAPQAKAVKVTVRSAKRRKRGLGTAAVEMVKTAGTPMTAKAVTDRLEQSGFVFGSRNHQVAVSKALRQASKLGKLAFRHNGQDRSPIVYTPVATAPQVPGQESIN